MKGKVPRGWGKIIWEDNYTKKKHISIFPKVMIPDIAAGITSSKKGKVRKLILGDDI